MMRHLSPSLPVLWILAVPLLTLLLVAGLLASLRGLALSPAADPAPAAPQPLPTASLPNRPIPAPTAKATPVAIVDGVAIPPDALATALAVDRAMSHLSGIPLAPAVIVLEQLVNGELVWQAMARQGADTTVDTAVVQAALLAQTGGDETALDVALAKEGVSRQAFDQHLTRLVAVDRFVRLEAIQLGVNEEEYLRMLQRLAQISFAPRQAWPGAPPFVATTTVPAATAIPEIPVEIFAVTPATPAATADAVPDGADPGLAAPVFMLPSVDGQVTVTLAALAGQPLVLSFWTTWCPYCLRQTPVLVAAHARYATDGIQFVGIDVKEEASVVEAYVDQHQIPYPIALDPDGAVASLYGVTGYPTTLFITADGQIAARHLGALTAETVDEYVAQWLRHAQ